MDEDDCERLVSLEKLVRCDESRDDAGDGSNGYYTLRSHGKGRRRGAVKSPRPRRRPSKIIAPAGCMFDRDEGVPPHLRKLGLCDDDVTPRVPLESMAPVVARCLQQDRDTVLGAYGDFLRAIGVNPRGRARCLQEIDAIHDAFFDWFAYDYTYSDGMTVLESFLMENAAGVHRLTHERVKALWSVLNCSIEGAFYVERVCAFARLTVLRSLQDGFKLHVEDSRMAMCLLGCENTFIAGRFTQFGGMWRPSARPFHIPTPYRSVIPGAVDDQTAMRVRTQRSRQRMSRRRSLASYTASGSCGTLFPGVPDSLVPDPVNSISLEWFMASGTFDISQFVPVVPEDDHGTDSEGRTASDAGRNEKRGRKGGGDSEKARKGRKRASGMQGKSEKESACSSAPAERDGEAEGEEDDLTLRMPLSDCRNEHGHICDAKDREIAGMSYLQLLGLVFCAPGEEPYDQHGYESRDYMMLCNELFDMGVML